MRKLVKFFRLPRGDQRLMIEAVLLLGAFRGLLWILPFSAWEHLVMRNNETTKCQIDRLSILSIVHAIEIMSHYIPHADCLPQALSARVMLARRGQPSQIRVGVIKNEHGQLNAHAWVQIEDWVVIGELRDLARYSTFPVRANRT